MESDSILPKFLGDPPLPILSKGSGCNPTIPGGKDGSSLPPVPDVYRYMFTPSIHTDIGIVEDVEIQDIWLPPIPGPTDAIAHPDITESVHGHHRDP